MKKTGQLLKEAREAKGISLQEVSIHLKISSRILKALEDGDKDQLPAKTFLRGFVQSYAQFLRLDGSEVLELFQAEMGTTHPKIFTKQVENLVEEKTEKTGSLEKVSPVINQVNATAENINNFQDSTVNPNNSTKEVKKESHYPQVPLAPSLSVDHKTWSRSLKFGTLIIILVIAGIIYGVVNIINKYEKEATIVKSESDLQVLPRTESEPLTLPISPELENGALEGAVTNNQQPMESTKAAEPSVGGSEKPTSAQSLEHQPVLNSNEAPTSVGTPVDLKAINNQPSEIKQNTIEPVSRPQEVIVEALEKVTIEYSIDDKTKATMVLNAEKVHTFKGDKKLSLSFSDGASVNLIYNGKDKGVPGKLGEPIKINFPE